jgi:glycosyltransferase 2 family protein
MNFMNKKVVLILKFSFSAILLIYIFIKIPAGEIFHAIESANFFFILAALSLTVLVVILSSYQTKYLVKVQNFSMTLKEIITIYLVTNFYSIFLPGSLSAGVVKWYKFTKFVSKSSAAAIIIFNRFLELLVVLMLAILYSIPSLIENQYKAMMIIFIIIFFVLVIGYIVLLNTQLLNKLTNLVQKLSVNSFYVKKISNLLGALTKFENLRMKDHIEIIGIMITYHLLGLISFYLLANALGINISIWILGWIGSVITILSLFPISMSGLGIGEVTLIYFLGFYGVAPHNAVALSLLAFLRILFISSVGGLLELKGFIFKDNHTNREEIIR